MKNYQPKKSKYVLPQGIYLSTLWIIRDYYRMKESIEDFKRTSIFNDESHKESNRLDSHEIKLGSHSDPVMIRLRAIEQARKEVPGEYMHGVWDNIQYRIPFPDDARRASYFRYKQKYIYTVAEKMGLTSHL